MTREHAKQLLPIITAFANGEEVQGFEEVSNEWVTLHQPSFLDCAKAYRIAPKPRKVWVNEYPTEDGKCLIMAHDTKDRADRDATSRRVACYELELPPLP